MKNSLGIVGLGNAGSALASAYSGRIPLIGFDANLGRRDTVSDLDLVWAESVADVAAKADVVLLSLPRPDISRAVVAEILSVSERPQSVVETSTVTPRTARDLGALCAAEGVAFVDAAIGGGVQSMADGKVTFLVGGEPDDVARVRPVLDLVAETIHHLGPVGAGSGAKIVNNGVMHALMVVLIEAAAMGRKLGIEMPRLVEILGRPDGIRRPLEHRVRDRMVGADYAGGMSVTNARKDSMLALETAQDCGVPLFATLAAHTPYEIAQQQGLGDLDYAALAKLWEEWCDVDFSKD